MIHPSVAMLFVLMPYENYQHVKLREVDKIVAQFVENFLKWSIFWMVLKELLAIEHKAHEIKCKVKLNQILCCYHVEFLYILLLFENVNW